MEQAIELNGVAVERNVAALRWGRQWVVDPESVIAAAGLASGAIVGPTPSTDRSRSRSSGRAISSATSRRVLASLPRRCSTRSARQARHAELVDAVARNLYKLMAYKDEYEVARLLLAPEAKAAAEAVGGKGAKVDVAAAPADAARDSG